MEKQLRHLYHSVRSGAEAIDRTPSVDKATNQHRLINFLDVQLRSGAKFSVNDEFPSLFGDYPGGESLYLEAGGEIVSHVGFVVREFQHTAYRMKVGIIGSVVTAPAHRGKGMASTLLSTAVAHLKRKGCILGLLWGDASEFYKPLGFHRGGRELDLIFSSASVPSMPLEPMEFDAKKHPMAIWRLYQQHDVKLDRSLEEQRRLCQVPNIKIYVTEKEGQLTSYLVVNKGADFSNFIHEWGGSIQELQANISSVQKKVYGNQNLTLIAPSHYDLAALRPIAQEKRDGVLGLIKLIDRQSLVLQYLQFLTSKGLKHRWDKQNQILHCEGSVYSLETDSDYLEIILGGSLAGLPPLPFFLWGFDSI